MGPQSRTVDEKIGRIARSQHGVVTRKQLLEAGITIKELKGRLRRKTLLRVHPGVYRVGHRAPSIEARYMAAVLACGEGALLSGLAAAHLWGLTRGTAPPPEVIAPTERRVKGVKTRRKRRSTERGTTCRGIPVTTVPSTLVDISSLLPSPDLARACHEAGVKYGTTPSQVEAVLATRPTAPGSKKLRKVLSGDERVTLSALERRFLKLLDEGNIPLPETNRSASGRRVDCRWPGHNLTVELDSYRYHRSRHAWEQDRKREREARARGDEFCRYTHDDVLDTPEQVLGELRVLLRVAKR
jgi:very-short-patch-repair endonuclease